ncbi:MerR family transcriptional regulator [Streptomyces sp. NPDC007083]|uniref:helix-turn-helix domain-containing protein n=1 Tax=unclassified Streptomyces TaxID=2593676 RepID=UPI00340F0A0D
MAWSTREIAELAGTSLRAVRHYHEVGLLEEPERRANGYKQYGVAHLVRLLRIKRLVDLGFSLSRIAEMGATDDHPENALRTLDAELAATIERLQRARAELALILDKSAPTDLPPEFATTANTPMPEADRSFVTVMGTVLGPEGVESYADFLRDPTIGPIGEEFEKLPGDAGERIRADLAERLVPSLRALYRQHPGLATLPADAARGEEFVGETIDRALVDLYNPAQVDVMRRVSRLLAETGGSEQEDERESPG